MRRQRSRGLRALSNRRRMTSHMEAIAAPLPSLPGHVPEGPGGGASCQKRSAGTADASMRAVARSRQNCQMVRVTGDRDATPGS